MKMRVRKKINWMKRMVAAGMTVCMVLTTPASALAGAEEGTETQTISKKAAGESILDTGAGSVDAVEDGGTGGQTESTEQSGTKNRTDSAESSEKDGGTEETESAENETQQDGSDAENQTPTLTLDGAVDLAKYDEAKDKLKVDANTKTITVTDGIGLILLSNVEPSAYKEYTINLVTTSGWDLTGTAEIDKKTYSFLGLGDDANPYEGKFEFDKKTVAEKFSITTTKALFQALSTKAKLDSISFSI